MLALFKVDFLRCGKMRFVGRIDRSTHLCLKSRNVSVSTFFQFGDTCKILDKLPQSLTTARRIDDNPRTHAASVMNAVRRGLNYFSSLSIT